MKPEPSRTFNQLHFEDLDPHRFEDLVRQLVYGFRNWTILEALGRSGADAGVDIRGVEVRRATTTDDEGDLEPVEARGEERVWFIQCKREKQFGPSKARAVVATALAGAAERPDGFILAAPCDLSRQTRETLAADLRSAGVREVHAWGKADLEDLLFLPENDHLLFAYFGVSLQVRRRNRSTELRGRLAKKRQIYRTIGDLEHRGWTAVLVRDPDETGYPFPDRVQNFGEEPPWQWTAFRHHSNPDTLALIVRRHHAWLTQDRKRYDYLDTCSHVVPHRNGFDKVPGRDEELCERVWRYFHNEIPEDERAWLEIVGWIDYDDILLVDDLGDAFNEPPHVLVNRGIHGFFSHTRAFLQLDRNGSRDPYDPAELRRANLFPDPIPDVQWRDHM